MYSGFKIITLSHKELNLRDLGNFVVQSNDANAKGEKLKQLKDFFALDELFYMQTCNRVVFFLYKKIGIEQITPIDWFEQLNPSLDLPQLKWVSKNALVYIQEDVIKHLFRLMSSLESLVIGEREVFRQSREAYDQCAGWGLCGDNMRLLMRIGVVCSKEVFTDTKIGDKSVSIVSLSIQKFLEQDLPKKSRILIIGAGQTILMVSKFLLANNYKNVSVFNRTVQNADLIAQKFGKKGYKLSELQDFKEGFDCIILCTASTKIILTEELYAKLLQGDKVQKVIVDLSIPYNFDKHIINSFDVNFIGVEELREIANQNMEYRKNEMILANAIVQKYVEDFKNIYHQRLIERSFQQFPVQVKEIKEKALNVVYKKRIDALDGDSRELLNEIVNYFEKKYIALPIKSAKESILR